MKLLILNIIFLIFIESVLGQNATIYTHNNINISGDERIFQLKKAYTLKSTNTKKEMIKKMSSNTVIVGESKSLGYRVLVKESNNLNDIKDTRKKIAAQYPNYRIHQQSDGKKIKLKLGNFDFENEASALSKELNADTLLNLQTVVIEDIIFSKKSERKLLHSKKTHHNNSSERGERNTISNPRIKPKKAGGIILNN